MAEQIQAKFKVSEVVGLRSGGRAMTIEAHGHGYDVERNLEPNVFNGYMHCVWFDEKIRFTERSSIKTY